MDYGFTIIVYISLMISHQKDYGYKMYSCLLILLVCEQIDGLPAQFDENVLSDYVTQFGTIRDLEVQLIDGCSSLRYR